MIVPFLKEQPATAIRRANANQHCTRYSSHAWNKRVVGFRVRISGLGVAPIGHFIEHDTGDGFAAHAAEGIRRDDDLDPIGQFESVAGLALDQRTQQRLTLEVSRDITMDNLRLIAIAGKTQHARALARPQMNAVVDQGGDSCDGAGDRSPCRCACPP